MSGAGLQASDFKADSIAGLKWLGEQIPGGFFIYQAGGDQELVYENLATWSIYGCETQDEFDALTGRTFRGLVHPDDYGAVVASIDEQIADRRNNKVDSVKYRIVRKDGEVRWVDDYGRYAQLPGYGDVYYVFISDITEKQQLVDESKRRAEVIEGLSGEYASVYLVELDTGTMIPYRLSQQYFQRIIADLGGQGSADMDYREVFAIYACDYVLEEDRERFLQETAPERIRDRVEQEGSYTMAYRRRGEEGDLLYTEMNVSGIGGGCDSTHAVIGLRDVTEQTLRVQRDMAERLHMEMELERERHANEVKSSFLFNISHDIRTPMNAIMGFSDLAKRHMDDSQRLADYLDKVEESSRQMLALIDDMLEMSRIDYGRIELKAEPANLSEQIGLVLDLFRPQAEEKKLSLVERLDLPDADVLVDAHRFRRIVGNLVSNAVKFTPDGGTVTVSACQKQVSDSGYARFEFCVSDTGIGMSPDFMKKMYEAFEREETSTKAGTVGTGLGLSITKSLLEMMGGSISVQSKRDEGSSFTVDLPLKIAGDSASSSEAAEPEVDHRAEGEYRILLVEDIEINRMLAETVLEEADFLVESVPDGCDAVDAVQNHPQGYYDLVLMDIQMPVMNGYEATRAIRALNREDTADLPIIALSANAREEDKRMSMESGMDSHVAKPFDVANLITTVNAHIAARRISR